MFLFHFLSLIANVSFNQKITFSTYGGPLGLSIVGGTDHSCLPFGNDNPGIFISKVSFQVYFSILNKFFRHLLLLITTNFQGEQLILLNICLAISSLVCVCVLACVHMWFSWIRHLQVRHQVRLVLKCIHSNYKWIPILVQKYWQKDIQVMHAINWTQLSISSALRLIRKVHFIRYTAHHILWNMQRAGSKRS